MESGMEDTICGGDLPAPASSSPGVIAIDAVAPFRLFGTNITA